MSDGDMPEGGLNKQFSPQKQETLDKMLGRNIVNREVLDLVESWVNNDGQFNFEVLKNVDIPEILIMITSLSSETREITVDYINDLIANDRLVDTEYDRLLRLKQQEFITSIEFKDSVFGKIYWVVENNKYSLPGKLRRAGGHPTEEINYIEQFLAQLQSQVMGLYSHHQSYPNSLIDLTNITVEVTNILRYNKRLGLDYVVGYLKDNKYFDISYSIDSDRDTISIIFSLKESISQKPRDNSNIGNLLGLSEDRDFIAEHILPSHHGGRLYLGGIPLDEQFLQEVNLTNITIEDVQDAMETFCSFLMNTIAQARVYLEENNRYEFLNDKLSRIYRKDDVRKQLIDIVRWLLSKSFTRQNVPNYILLISSHYKEISDWGKIENAGNRPVYDERLNNSGITFPKSLN